MSLSMGRKFVQRSKVETLFPTLWYLEIHSDQYLTFGTCLLCLHNKTLCGFSTFFSIYTATHVTAGKVRVT